MSGVHRALERIRFGPRRTLNVRDGLLTGVEAARRVDGWLRARQVELGGEVLIITGRGAGSVDGVAVVREETLRKLHALKRAGVIGVIREDTPGSFIVTLAPLRTMLDAPNRRKPGTPPPAPPSSTIAGLSQATAGRLRELALRSLDSLGVRAANEASIRDEMERQFSRLVRSAPGGTSHEKWISTALDRAILEYEDGSTD